jgi:DinB superfamily
MTTIESIILNFEEIRRRSIKLWSGVIPEFYQWRPDINAQSCIGMIRHVLETENIYRLIIINKGGNADDFISPWKDKPFTDLQNELEFAMPFRKEFLETLRGFTPGDLTSIEIVRNEGKQEALVIFCSGVPIMNRFMPVNFYRI